jgi:hypothetical protein
MKMCSSKYSLHNNQTDPEILCFTSSRVGLMRRKTVNSGYQLSYLLTFPPLVPFPRIRFTFPLLR